MHKQANLRQSLNSGATADQLQDFDLDELYRRMVEGRAGAPAGAVDLNAWEARRQALNAFDPDEYLAEKEAERSAVPRGALDAGRYDAAWPAGNPRAPDRPGAIGFLKDVGDFTLATFVLGFVLIWYLTRP
jgi:hypothetical protein